ncbi:MAG: c-type cytochrome biogenesis protein CcmI [Alphaproteobacteria bacterium]|nr:c-type cytochrome biogenesis protein CcmI [Alphaproteobacteria bacterium]
MEFWIIVALTSVIVTLAVAWPLLRAPKKSTELTDDYDMRVYRDQLSEVDHDLARGVLSEEEAKQVRTEVSRRVLAADASASTSAAEIRIDSSRKTNLTALAVMAVFLLGGASGTYYLIGSAGTADQPLAQRLSALQTARDNRLSQKEVETRVGNITEMEDKATDDYKKLVAKLREAVKQRPDDLRGLNFLVQNEARLGRFAAAHQAKSRAITISGSKATGTDYTDLAELMIIAAGGYVSPEAEAALAQAFAKDPEDPRARYYSGLDLAQNGRADIAYKVWINLLDEGPEDAPWIAPIRGQIADVALMAGIRLAPPPPLAGPTADQIKNAANMSEKDRRKLINGMVRQLSERLASGGGTADEWARLIRAYGVLGETEKAKKIWGEAKLKFASNAKGLGLIKEAATSAGVAD